jgi:hypothetical protein
MKKMSILALVLVLVMALTACGSEKAPETTAPATTAAATVPAETAAPAEPLALSTCELSVSTWSSPNGATVHLTATPNFYAEGQMADFVVRLESDDVVTVPCQWDGSNYKADADLNAANGYCYYVVLTAADGTVTEVAVNTPAAPINEALINLEASLTSYCNLIVEESEIADNKLNLTKCTIQVQAPVITNDGQSISCQEASLVLDCSGQILTQAVSGLTATDTAGLFEADLSGTSLDVPEMSADQTIELTLNVTLSNGQSLTAFGSSWVCSDESVLPVVG